MDATGKVNIIFEGQKLSMPADSRLDEKLYADGSKFYLTGVSGKLFVVTNKTTTIVYDTDTVLLDGTKQKVIDVFHRALQEAQELEQKTFKWKFNNKIMPLVDLTSGFRNLTTAIRPRLDYTGGPSIMRSIDGTMIILFGAYKVHESAVKLFDALHKLHTNIAPLIDFLEKGDIASKEAWKAMIKESFAFVEVGEIFDAGSEMVFGFGSMLVGAAMILLSAILWSGKTVLLPLADVLMVMYVGSLFLSLVTLYKSVTQSYNLWINHSALKELMLEGNLVEALKLLELIIDPTHGTGPVDSEVLASIEEQLNDLIASGDLKKRLQTEIGDLIDNSAGKEEKIIELIQEVLDDNVKQRTIHAIKIMLALWGVLYTVVGIITTGGIATVAINTLAWAVSFAVLSCLTWFALDNAPLAEMVGNVGVWLVRKKDALRMAGTS